MAVAHANGETDHDTALAGNLCRCTGYAPIIRAARAAEAQPVPDWMNADRSFFLPEISENEHQQPRTTAQLAAAYLANPDATLVAGATDVGLWVTKQMRDLGQMIFLGRCTDLQQITQDKDSVSIGAGVTIARMIPLMEDIHPSFAAMLRRYGSAQVRAAATIGGNIANGSPIGDGPPALIALGATLHLRQWRRPACNAARGFLSRLRQAGSHDRGICRKRQHFQPDRPPALLQAEQALRSGYLGCVRLFQHHCRTGSSDRCPHCLWRHGRHPKRAAHVEAALTGQPWTEATVTTAPWQPFAQDYTPTVGHARLCRIPADQCRQHAAPLLSGGYWPDHQPIMEVQP
jgi:xanthine dehydrogenase small subunit